MQKQNFDKVSSQIIDLLNQKKEYAAFKIIVEAYNQRLYWHIRRIVLNHDDANDVIQNTYLKIWKALSKFKGNSKVYTWIYRIATNEAITFINKNKNILVSIDGISHQDLKSSVQSNLLSGDEIQLKLEKAISQLPPKQRIVFNLRYFEELKYKDISIITNTSVGGLKASYHIAVKKIEKYLTTN